MHSNSAILRPKGSNHGFGKLKHERQNLPASNSDNLILPSFQLLGYRVWVRNLAPWGENKTKIVNIVNFAGAGLPHGARTIPKCDFHKTALPMGQE